MEKSKPQGLLQMFKKWEANRGPYAQEINAAELNIMYDCEKIIQTYGNLLNNLELKTQVGGITMHPRFTTRESEEVVITTITNLRSGGKNLRYCISPAQLGGQCSVMVLVNDSAVNSPVRRLNLLTKLEKVTSQLTQG